MDLGMVETENILRPKIRNGINCWISCIRRAIAFLVPTIDLAENNKILLLRVV